MIIHILQYIPPDVKVIFLVFFEIQNGRHGLISIFLRAQKLKNLKSEIMQILQSHYPPS